MQIIVISDSAGFFQEVHGLCRPLFVDTEVLHLSMDQWQARCPAEPMPSAWLVMEPSAANTVVDPGSATTASSPLAITRLISPNVAEIDSDWEVLSRNDFLLRAKEISASLGESEFTERVLLQTDDLRITELQLAGRCMLIPKIRERLLHSIEEFSLASDSVQNHFCMALDEALANAFYHGSLELCSSLKEDGSSRFSQLAAERELRDPWRRRRVGVSEMASRFGLWITIQDEGPGFDVSAAMARCEDPETMLCSGRGLMMMRAFADELFFNKPGNQVTLVLYRRRSDDDDFPVDAPITVKDGCLVHL